jgi:hypothetical protein
VGELKSHQQSVDAAKVDRRLSVGSAQRRRSVIRRNSYGGNPAGSRKPAAVNDLHKVEEVIQIQHVCLSPSIGTAYEAIEMAWAKLVGQIAQAE